MKNTNSKPNKNTNTFKKKGFPVKSKKFHKKKFTFNKANNTNPNSFSFQEQEQVLDPSNYAENIGNKVYNPNKDYDKESSYLSTKFKKPTSLRKNVRKRTGNKPPQKRKSVYDSKYFDGMKNNGNGTDK